MIYDTLLSRVQLRERVAQVLNADVVLSSQVRYLFHLALTDALK